MCFLCYLLNSFNRFCLWQITAMFYVNKIVSRLHSGLYDILTTKLTQTFWQAYNFRHQLVSANQHTFCIETSYRQFNGLTCLMSLTSVFLRQQSFNKIKMKWFCFFELSCIHFTHLKLRNVIRKSQQSLTEECGQQTVALGRKKLNNPNISRLD